jgi:hypothetical protein
MRAAHGGGERLAVERHQRARIDDLHLDPLIGEATGGLEAFVHHPRGGDHGHVTPGALDIRGSERDQRLGLRHLADHAIQRAVLENQHRIGIADRGLQQPARIGGRRRNRDFEAGQVHEPRLDGIGMMAAARLADAVRHPQGQRAVELAAEHVARLRDLVRDLVHRARHEIGEMHVDHGDQAGGGGAEGRAHDGRLRDRRVEDAVRAELVDQPSRDAERQAEDDVLADAEHARIPPHLLAQRQIQRVGEVHAHVEAPHVINLARGSTRRDR